jgi:hypothetical protein
MARRNLQFDPGELPNSYNSGAALVSGDVIIGDGPARLYNLTVTSQDSAEQYILLFDAIAVPANGQPRSRPSWLRPEPQQGSITDGAARRLTTGFAGPPAPRCRN